MSTILGISGSLRKMSYNSSLLRAARDIRPDLIEIGSIRGIPLYDADLEAEGVPEPVVQLKRQLAGACALLIATPEYNNSVPGVLKNAIDWLSRPAEGMGNVFQDKPLALMGASPGRFGTALSQSAWLPVFRALGARHWTGGWLRLSGAAQVFDDNGTLTDEGMRERLEKFLQGFIGFAGLDRL